MLIITTAIVGVYYAKYEGLNTLKSGFVQLSKNETPAYEVISGAAIAFAALMLIIPGFATDVLGFCLIFPLSRKMIFNKFSKKFASKQKKRNNFNPLVNTGQKNPYLVDQHLLEKENA